MAIQVILDNKKYTKGIKVPDQDFNLINIKRNGFHGEWNYIIAPQIA